MRVDLVPAELRDAEEIMKNLRDEDARGIELLQLNGEAALKIEIERATCCYTGKIDGEVAVIWGVTSATLLSGIGFVWMVTSKAADKAPFIFARRSQREIEAVLKRTPVLTGTCFAYNRRSLRWLRWLGAEIGMLKHHQGVACYPFTFRRI